MLGYEYLLYIDMSISLLYAIVVVCETCNLPNSSIFLSNYNLFVSNIIIFNLFTHVCFILGVKVNTIVWVMSVQIYKQYQVLLRV